MERRLSLRRAVRLRCARSPYLIPYPLPIYSDHKGTDILSPSDRDPVTIPEERDPRSIRNGRRGRGNSNRDPKGNETPETVSRWRIGNREPERIEGTGRDYQRERGGTDRERRRRGDRPSMEERVTGWRPDRERGRRNPIRDPRTFYLLSVGTLYP